MEKDNTIDLGSFDGVFRFTNPTDEDFTFLWNSREYTYPANSTSKMIILGESPENVQEIRKKCAYKLAVREFYKGKVYKSLVAMGNKAGGIPPIFDEKLLEPMIEKCLTPLPEKQAVVKEGKRARLSVKATKAVSENDNLPQAFADDAPTAIGKQSDTFNV